MKKEKEPVAPSSRTSTMAHSMQLLHRLLPFILGAAMTILLFKILIHHKATVNFAIIREKMANIQQRWDHIVKDPACRIAATAEPPSNFMPDYEYNSDDDVPSPPPEPVVIPEKWTDSSLFDIAEFQWIMNNESICVADPNAPSDTRLLPVLIHSSRNHYNERSVIRKSWGSIPIYKKWDVRLIFLLGESSIESVDKDNENLDSGDYNQSEDEEEREKLEEEQGKYGDLVVGNFNESPKNATYKHMMGYKWILNFCSNATFVMKVEENKFVDIIQWLEWRTRDLEILEKSENKEEVAKVPDLYCSTFYGGLPVREEGNFYYASMEDWPEPNYPEYCSSWGYGITVPLMKKVYWMSTIRKFFWIDDVYFGALLDLVKSKFDWEPLVIYDCYKTYSGLPDKYRQICEENGAVHFDKEKGFGPVAEVGSGKFENDMMCLWNKTLHDSDYKFQ